MIYLLAMVVALILSLLIYIGCMEAEDESDFEYDYIPEGKFHRNDEGDDVEMRTAFGAGVIRNGVKTYVTRQGAGISRVTGSTHTPVPEEGAVKRVMPVQPVEVDVMPWFKELMNKKIQGSNVDVRI